MTCVTSLSGFGKSFLSMNHTSVPLDLFRRRFSGIFILWTKLTIFWSQYHSQRDAGPCSTRVQRLLALWTNPKTILVIILQQAESSYELSALFFWLNKRHLCWLVGVVGTKIDWLSVSSILHILKKFYKTLCPVSGLSLVIIDFLLLHLNKAYLSSKISCKI